MAEERPTLEPETLDLLFSITQHAPATQLRAVEALDAKIIQVFTAGGVLLGLAALRGSHHQTLVGVLFLVAVVSFLFVAFHVLRSMFGARFRVEIAPPQLWRDYWADPPESIKHAIVADIATGYEANERLIARKARTLAQAVIGAGAEAVAIGVALAVSTL
jgi:hypothetical protein